MSDFSAQVASATRQIKAKGCIVLLQAAVGGVDAPFAADTPLPPALPVPMLSINAGLARYFKFKPTKDEDRLEASLLLLMAAVGVEPGYRSSFVWPDGKTYYVKAYDVLAPNGVPILYFLEAAQ